MSKPASRSPEPSASNATSVFHPASTMNGPRSVSKAYTRTYRSTIGSGTGMLHSPGRTCSTGGSGLLSTGWVCMRRALQALANSPQLPRSSVPDERHVERGARVAAVLELDARLDLVVRDSLVERLERDPQLHPGEVRTEAPVEPAGERDVGIRPAPEFAPTAGPGSSRGRRSRPTTRRSSWFLRGSPRRSAARGPSSRCARRR